MQAYLHTYDAFLPFLNLDVEALCTSLKAKFAAGGFNLAELRALVHTHRTAAVTVLESVPASINLGLVQVNATEVRSALSRKHRDLSEALLKLMSAHATDISNEITRAYEAMNKALSASVNDIESLVALKEYMVTCPDKVKDQRHKLEAAQVSAAVCGYRIMASAAPFKHPRVWVCRPSTRL